MMDDLFCNGYILQKKGTSDYYGVEGDNWYLNYMSDNSYFRDYYMENIDRAWQDEEVLDSCINDEYVKKYIEESIRLGIEYRVLFCYSTKRTPIFNNKIIGNSIFLGYDYAYSGGSYYSSVLNDICSKRIREFENFRLNSNGLFETYEEVEEFVALREKLKGIENNSHFEEGDYAIYKILEIKQ